MRLRTKTILGVAVIEMVLLAVLVGSALSILRESNEAELMRRVQLGGKLLTAAAKDAVISQDLATLDSLVAEAMASGQIDFVRVLDTGGRVLAESGNASLLARPFHPESRIEQVADSIFDWSGPVLAGGIRHGEVQLAVSTAPLRVLLASAQRWAAGIAGLEMLLVALFSWLLGSYLVRQLGALRKATDRFAAGDFEHRVPEQGSDELADTATAFNRMAQQLGDSNELLRAENLKRLEAQQAAERAQAQAEDRTEQLNTIFALSPDGFVSFDAARRVKYANRAFLRLTGLTEQDIVGSDETAFVARLARECIEPARLLGMAARHAQRQAGAGGAVVEPAEGRRRGGRNVIELAGASKRVLEVGVRMSDAATVSQILYFRDVTHETEVDRMKSEFLSTAAHELRTPMASIYGFSELLLAQKFDEATQHDLMDTIHRNAELMASIINELLDLARIEARRGKDFVFEPVQVQQFVGKVVANYKPPQGREAPQLELPAGVLWMRADAGKMEQALGNVLSNAYKFSPAGGAVRIELVEQGGQGGGSEIGLRVTDQGVGMTAEQQARVGERFYRADASGKIPGTGLGVSIVREIVDLHGGALALSSKVGAGTTVTLWIPEVSGALAATPGAAARA